MRKKPGRRLKIQTGLEEIGLRIDLFLSKNPEISSRSQAQKMLRQGMVKVDGKIVAKNFILNKGQAIEVDLPEKDEVIYEPEEMPLSIIYEDKFLLAVSKPAGLVVHPAAGHKKHTLVNGLLYYFQETSGKDIPPRAGIVHRLDKDTSGLLLVAKNLEIHQKLVRALRERKIERSYLALVQGKFEKTKGKIDAPVGRSMRNRKKMSITGLKGRQAVTYFEVLREFKDYSLIEARLETGRTHQIRVHFAYIQRPVAGDKTYGRVLKIDGYKLKRQFLHAYKLELKHPFHGRKLIINDKLPADLAEAIAVLEEHDRQ